MSMLMSFVLLVCCGSLFAEQAKLLPDYVEVGQHRFYTDAPVRYPPVTRNERIYFGSDDGYLYCLNASTGKLKWRFRSGPSNRKMLGAGRLISAWPVSGGPVIHKGRVYFAAGLWPFMGVFVYSVDAETGKVLWVNDNATSLWKSDAVSEQRPQQPSFEPSFISVVPMGALRVEENRLVVPCGRAEPAYFDLTTGAFLKFHHGYKKPHQWGEGHLPYPDYDSIADETQGCFPRDSQAETILKATGVRDGYALVLGIGDGRLVEGLITASRLRLIVLDPDQKKIDALRKRLEIKSVYGNRVSVHASDVFDMNPPPYLFSLVVSGDLNSSRISAGDRFWKTIFTSLRPYGGMICLTDPGDAPTEQLRAAQFAGARIDRRDQFMIVKRVGALPGADSWSHEFANAANTRSTTDDLVKSPFATLWSGGPASEVHRYYENHRGYAVPKVAGGRLFIEGPKLISAFDVYTGRFLWEWQPGPEDKENWFYRVKTSKMAFEPMAGRTTAADDAFYVISDQKIHALDASTGKPLESFQFKERGDWGGVRLLGDTLFVPTAKSILAMNRYTGEVRWRYTEAGGTLAVGGNKVFCIEYPWPDRFNNAHLRPESRWIQFIEDWEKIKRRGTKYEKDEQKLVALNAGDGTPLWERSIQVTRNPVRRMIYSEEHDLLLLLGSRLALQGVDGKEAWKLNLTDHATLAGDLIWGYGKLSVRANLATRKVNERINPITLKPQQWSIRKTGNGCGPILAGKHLVTLRSGSAAYYDLGTDMNQTCGVVNLGGFRSSCQPSLIPAEGLLVSPNSASGGCTCRYPLATALAMVHAPEMNKWGAFGELKMNGPIRKLGINFGAPGDRLGEDGVLWLDYPSVGGPSPVLDIQTKPEQPEWYRHHPSRVVGEGDAHWIVSSGAKNLKQITIRLGNDQPRSYRVRIYYGQKTDDGRVRGIIRQKNDVFAADQLELSFEHDMAVCGIEVLDSKLSFED